MFYYHDCDTSSCTFPLPRMHTFYSDNQIFGFIFKPLMTKYSYSYSTTKSKLFFFNFLHGFNRF